MESSHKHHIAILAFPFASHPSILFSLARALTAASPIVAFSFLTSAKSAASLSRSFPDLPKNLRIFEISDGCPEGYVPESLLEEVKMFIRVMPGNFREGIEKTVEATRGVRITCVIFDVFLSFAGEMAEEMGVPWVAFSSSHPCSISAHLYTDLLRSKIGVDSQAMLAKADEDLGFIPGLSGLRVQDLPGEIISSDITNEEFAQFLYRMATELPRATVVVLNSFPGLNNVELEFDLSTKLKKTLQIGPLNLLSPNPTKSDQFNCIQWLDHHEPASVAYVSFGTSFCLPPPELTELAEGLEASGVPFLWSLKDSEKDQLLPAGFLDRTKDRGMVVPWAPQVKVLEHVAVGAFVTHCGWNSLMESIAGEVPMLCRPLLGDNMMDARSVTHLWRVGVGFEGGTMTKGEVVRALRTVMKEEEGKMMRERMGELKEKAVKAVRLDGTSFQNFRTLLEIVTGTRGEQFHAQTVCDKLL